MIQLSWQKRRYKATYIIHREYRYLQKWDILLSFIFRFYRSFLKPWNKRKFPHLSLKFSNFQGLYIILFIKITSLAFIIPLFLHVWVIRGKKSCLLQGICVKSKSISSAWQNFMPSPIFKICIIAKKFFNLKQYETFNVPLLL